jgi:TolB-like protein/Flp pilus assembly protein TadD
MRPGVVAIAAAVLLVFGFAGAAMYMRWTGARGTLAQTARPVAASAVPAPPQVPEASIAVLPFIDMSEKKDQEYFSDGLSEELINMLVKVHGLRVPARTSSFYFKGKTTTIARIAEELRVSNVLEGSVRKSGNRLRITVQLVRASTGYHLWSETYDRRTSDIFRIQEEISKSVVDALKVSLLPNESPAAVSRPSSDVYTLFLQARALIATHGTPETETAAGYLRRALEIDPKYAPAWALYVKTRTMLLDADAIPYRRAHDEALDAARRAIAADPALGAAHMAMVRFHIYFDWDWIAMADEVATARRLDPRDADTLRYAGSLALTLGRAEEAVSLFQRAGDLDPLDGANYILLGKAELALGRLAAARQAFQRSVELHPHLGAQYMLGEVARLSGDPAAALAIFEHEPGEDDRLFGEALTLRTLGRGAEADAALATLESKFANTDAYAIGCVYVVRGETDRAFAWLSRAYDQHDQSLTSLKSDPILKAVSGDARFAALLRKMKLPE